MKILIKVTKDIYKAAMMCGTTFSHESVPENCAIALAIREIAPNAGVYSNADNNEKRKLFIRWDPKTLCVITHLSPEVTSRINDFDDLSHNPTKRLELGEFSFEVDFPDEMVEMIGIDELKEILAKSQTLEMV